MKSSLCKSLLIALCLCATTIAKAFDGLVDECAPCTTDAAFRQRAKFYYDVGSPTLYNLKTGVIHTYRLSLKKGYPLQIDPPMEAIEVNEIPTDPAVYNAFVNVSGFYVAAGFRLQAAIDIPASDLGPNVPGLNSSTTAYDVTEDYNLRNRIGIEIALNKDRWNQVRAFINKIDQVMLVLLGLKSEASLEVRVIFSDGSSVLYRITTSSANSTKLEYVPGSATTPKNQSIPDANQPQYQGTWLGPSRGGDDMGRFGRHMNTIGASTNWSYGSGSQLPQEVRCSWKVGQSGNTLVCAASQY